MNKHLLNGHKYNTESASSIVGFNVRNNFTTFENSF